MKLIITLVVLIGLTLNVNAGDGDDKFDYCYYFNDPHLIPFITPDNPNPGVYFCKSNCTEILLKNKFVEIIVTADPQGAYPIVDYTIIFFEASSGLEPCAVTDNIANPPSAVPLCQAGSVATSTQIGSDYFHTHFSGELEVHVRDMGTWFNIYIEQTFVLIGESTGVCVEGNCEDLGKGGGRGRKKRQVDSDATFNKIIDTFVNAASEKALASGEVDRELVQFLRTAVLNDFRNTLNAEFGKTIVFSIFQDSVKQYSGKNEYVEQLRKADDSAKAVIRDNVENINKIIRDAQICKEIGGVRKCLEPISG